MSAHTPGPWSAKTNGKYFSDHAWTVDNDEESTYDAAPVHANGHVVAMVVSCDMDDDLFDANARLIAAAPDLYDVADDAPVISKYHGPNGFDVGRFIDDYETWNKKKRSALAKARGERA